MGHFIAAVRTVLWQISIAILFLFTLIFFPFTIVILSPIYLIRRLVSTLSKIFRPDLGKMLTTRSTVFATDEIYTCPKATLVVFLIAELEVQTNSDVDESYIESELNRHRSDIVTRLISVRKPDGTPEHPELQQYVSSWLGFYFWKFDKTFNIDNHINEYDGDVKFDVLDEDSILAVSKELSGKPFKKGHSPWELIGFPKVKLKGKHCETIRPQGAVAFRIHHSLADGYSILKLLVAEIAAIKVDLAQPSVYKRSLLSEIFNKTTFCLRAPYEFLSQLVSAYDCNEWHVSESKISPNINFCLTEKIPLSYMKEIKLRNDVSFTAVIFAAFAGALRSFMLERGVKVPDAIHCVAPFPVPGHPDKLRNYMTAIFVRLPVGTSHPDKRLRTIEAHLKKLKRSSVPYTQFLLFPLMGGLFPWMSKYLFKQYYSTAILSSFPGPKEKICYDGKVIHDLFFTGGMLPGRIGISLTSLSYGGFIRIGAGFNEGVLDSSVPIKCFTDKIMEELKILHQNGMNTTNAV